jgi:hypothetical protein
VHLTLSFIIVTVCPPVHLVDTTFGTADYERKMNLTPIKNGEATAGRAK